MVALFLATTALWAERFQEGDLYYYVRDTPEKEVAVTYEGMENNPNYVGITSIAIPSAVTHNGITYAVTHIGYRAFLYCTSLTSVTIPNSVESIGEEAFYDCTGLTSITIPNSVESIDYYAFGNVPNIVYSGTATGSPWGAKAVNGYVEGSIVYEDATKTKLLGCTTTANGDISIPNTVTSIAKEAFRGCSDITSVTIPNSVTSIGSSAFSGCTGLTSVTIPVSITSIGEYAFSACSNLTSVVWNAKSCGDFSYYRDYSGYHSSSPFNGIRTQITSFTFGDGVETIPAYLCYEMNQLASVTIPNTVTSIGYNAFSGILNIVYSGSATGSPWGARGVNGCVDGYFLYEDATKTKILACSTAAPDGTVIPSSVTSIGDEAFKNCTLLKSITIPEGITSIGDDAFRGCSNLTSVVWNAKKCDGWSRYSAAPFYNIGDNITSFVFGNAVESIPDYLCYDMDYLTTVTIPSSVTSIGKEAFDDCYRLKYACVQSSTPPSCYDYGNSSFYKYSAIVIVPEEAVSTYRNHNIWDYYTISTYGLGRFKEATATQTTMDVQWIIYGKNKSGINGFQYSTNYEFANDKTNSVYLNVATDSVIQTDTLITGLTPNATYYLRSFIQTSDGQLVYGETTSTQTKGIALSVSSTSKTQKTLGIKVQYDAGDATHNGINGFIYCSGRSFYSDSKVDTVYFNKQDSAAVLDTIVRNLIPNTTYCFRAFLVTPYGRIESSEVNITTQAITSSATAVSSTQKTIEARLKYDWGDAENIVKYGYLVVGTPFTDTLQATGTITNPITLDTLVTGLTPDTEYTFRTFIETRDSVNTGLSEDFSNGISEWGQQIISTYGQWNCYNGVCQLGGRSYYQIYGWLFHSVNLIGGTEYTFSVRVKKSTSSSSYTVPDMAIGIGNSANSSSMTTIVSKETLSTDYEEVVGTYTPAESGTYYVGLYGHMKDPGPASYANTIYFDDFSVSSPLSGKIPMYITNEQTLKTLPVRVSLYNNGKTQTTLSLSGSYDCGDATNTGVNGIQWNTGTSLDEDYTTIAINKTDSAARLETVLTGLQPNTTYCARAYVVTAEGDTTYSEKETCKTQAITATTTCATRTQTKLGVRFNYDWGDVTNVTRYGYEVVGTSVRDTIQATGAISDTIKLDKLVTGLTPNTEYTFRTFIETRDSVPADSIVYRGDFSHGVEDYATANSYGSWSCSNGVFSFKRGYGEAIGQLYYEVYLEAGVAYKISTYIKKRYDSSSYATPEIKLIVNTEDDKGSDSTIVSCSSLSTEYEEITGIFTPAKTQYYLIGIYGCIPYSYSKASNIIDINEFSISASLSRKVLQTIRNKRIYSTLPVDISITDATTTQTTLAVVGSYDCGDATNIGINGIQYCEGSSWNNEYKTIAINHTDSSARLDTVISGLHPNTAYTLRAFIVIGNDTAYSTGKVRKTKEVETSLQVLQNSETKAKCHITYDAGDATDVRYGIEYCKGTSFSDRPYDTQVLYYDKAVPSLSIDTIVSGLVPNTQYAIRSFIEGDADTDVNRYIMSKQVNPNDSNTWICIVNDGIISESNNTCKFDPEGFYTYSVKTGKTYRTYYKRDPADCWLICEVKLEANIQYYFNMDVRSFSWTTAGMYLSDAVTPNSLNVVLVQDTSLYCTSYKRFSLEGHYTPTETKTYYIRLHGQIAGTSGWSSIPSKYSDYMYYQSVYFENVKVFVKGTEHERLAYSTTQNIATLPVTISTPTLTQYGQTYMLLATSSNYGDATLVEEAVEYGTSQSETQIASVSNNMVKINNLFPDTRYYYRSLLTTAEGGTIYSDWQEMTTKAITLSTGEADGISAKSVFLHGTIDCDMESRTEIGFEWKRSDAPATVKPQRVLVTDRADSTLVFRLEGLSKDKYYDYRTFCLYKEQIYYGTADDGREWVTFLTAEDDVLVAPSVQTLGAETSEADVVLSGFVVAGTENIIQKGFESWRKGTTDIATTVSEGAVMTNEIPEPWSYTTYQYRAYAKTPSGTTYGETREVTTGYIHKEITDVVVTPSATAATVTWTVVEQANYYILALFGNAEMTDTLATYTVDEAGNITQRRAPAALRALVNCNIDQLTPDTDYFFTVIAYNSDEKKVAEENGSFTTQLTTDIDNISDDEGDSDSKTDTGNTNRSGDLVRKVFRDGQVYILRGDKIYTITGVEVK